MNDPATTTITRTLTLALTSQTHPPTLAQMRAPDAPRRLWMVLSSPFLTPRFVRVWEGTEYGHHGQWYDGPAVQYPTPLADVDIAHYTHWFLWPLPEEIHAA